MNNKTQKKEAIFYYLTRIKDRLVVLWYKLKGPPRILNFRRMLNADILRSFGAKVGKTAQVYGPITLHNYVRKNIPNLIIGENCVLNGNHFFDLSAPIVMEDGVSLGPGVIIMTHNNYNSNEFLQKKLAHTCGIKGVVIKKGTGVKAGVLIPMGVTIGENCVVAGNAVVNRDIPDFSFAAGVPAVVKKNLKDEEHDGNKQ